MHGELVLQKVFNHYFKPVFSLSVMAAHAMHGSACFSKIPNLEIAVESSTHNLQKIVNLFCKIPNHLRENRSNTVIIVWHVFHEVGSSIVRVLSTT